MLSKPPGWDAVMAAGLLVCIAITWTSNPGIAAQTGQPLWAPWAVLAVFAASYLAIGRPAIRNKLPLPVMVGYGALLALIAGAATCLIPSLATIQCIVYPLAWCVLSTRGGILTSCAVAAAVFAGFLLSPIEQGDPGVLPISAGTTAVSLAFSLVLGIWINRVFTFAHERVRLLDELTAAQDELAVMHRQAGETDERARLARELHDTVTQSLTGLVMLAERTGARLRSGELGAGDAAEPVALIESTAREALAEARALVATMTPTPADSGLAEALQRLAARFERETGVAVEVRVCDRRVSREQEVVLLRCAQEGLANVRKHARAVHAVVEVASAEASGGPEISLRVADDGVGPGAASIDREFDDGGFGIAGMRERVGMLGGRLTLGPRQGGGAELAVVMPLVAAS